MRSPRHVACAARKRQRGIGLIEILVSVVILSIGFLAAARMQVQGMRYSQNAYFQSQAYFLANDMVDRMRSNIRGVTDGEYDNLSTSADASNPQCATSFCTSKQLASQDAYDWSARLHAMEGVSNFVPALPGSDAYPAGGSVTALGDGVYAVSLTWSELVDDADSQGSLTIHFAAEVPG